MLSVVSWILVFLASLLFTLSWQKHRFWSSRGVPGPFSIPFIGHMHTVFIGRWPNMDKMYYQFKSKGYWGIYEMFKPVLFVSDPSLVRDISIKDFEYFADRREFTLDDKDGIMNEMLFMVNGSKWKWLRSLMTPTFTSGKMKAMFPLVTEKADAFLIECDKTMKKNSFLDINTDSMYYTLDALAACVFGIDANSIQNREESMFVKGARDLFQMDFISGLKFLILQISPILYKILGLATGGKYDYLSSVLDKTVAARKESKTKRGDFLDNLLNMLNEKSESEYVFTMNTIKSQSFGFIFTGFDTTGGSLGLILYAIAKEPRVQNRLREELKKIIEADGEFNYQNVMECEYLDACVQEALRLYPAAFFVERKCVKDYKNIEHNIEIPKDTIVTIPLWSMQHDPAYWKEPRVFNPDRFLPENKQHITPYTYMPFGIGPRNCIAMRFVHMVMKILIAKMCLKFEMELRPGFKEVKMECVVDSLRPSKDGIQIVLEKIDS